MSAYEKINFHQVRDFNQVLNTTALFIRHNFSSIWKNFIIFVIPFVALEAIVGVVFGYDFSGMFQWDPNEGDIGKAILGAAMSLFPLIATQIYVSCYMIAYIDCENPPTTKDILGISRKRFFHYILANLVLLVLLGIAAVLSFVLLFLPLIYLIVSLTPFTTVFYREETGIFTSIERCFKLVNQRWWTNFGVYFVANMVMLACFAAVNVGYYILLIFGQFGALSEDLESIAYAGNIVFMIISAITFRFIYMFPLAVAVTMYFSLAEMMDRESLIERVEAIGRA